ncbi:MAG: hypothetical protein KBD17_02460 [Candidatus Pacebacteria bacterium]|nr:hypothetical protein [Candidatus Paceibacterota bacterium]
MPTGTTKRRIELRDAILNHPKVARIQGALMMSGNFPGGIIAKKIDFDEANHPHMSWDLSHPIPSFLKPFLCRDSLVAA